MIGNQPKIIFCHFSTEFREDEELALEDLREGNSQTPFWILVCRKGSPFSLAVKKNHPERLDAVIELDYDPFPFFNKELKHILSDSFSQGFNVLHLFGSDGFAACLPAIWSNPSVKVVISEFPEVKKSWRHFLQSFFYYRVDALVVPSFTLRRRVAKMRPSLSRVTRVIPPGIDLEVYNPTRFDFRKLRDKWGVDSDVYLVGMLCSDEHAKSQGTFIKAAASFLRNEELALRTRFVMIGFDSEKYAEYAEMIRQFRLEESILTVPTDEQLAKILGTLDVFVIPSSKAVFGLQAIESLATGTPIVCARGPDSVEWIGNSKAGLLMRSGDVFDLQRRIRMILENPETLREMGLKAVQYAQDFYDRRARVHKLMDMYGRVLRKEA